MKPWMTLAIELPEMYEEQQVQILADLKACLIENGLKSSIYVTRMGQQNIPTCLDEP